MDDLSDEIQNTSAVKPFLNAVFILVIIMTHSIHSFALCVNQVATIKHDIVFCYDDF